LCGWLGNFQRTEGLLSAESPPASQIYLYLSSGTVIIIIAQTPHYHGVSIRLIGRGTKLNIGDIGGTDIRLLEKRMDQRCTDVPLIIFVSRISEPAVGPHGIATP
jgi:hypothetical protein